MKLIPLLLYFFCFANEGSAQIKSTVESVINDTTKIVEAACGQCKFGLKGNGCNLAVRIEGKGYYVDGSKIDDHGDAHADDGFCNRIRKARVIGTVINDRFVATSFKLLPEEKAKP